jgi:hypothetical protein
VTYKYLGVRDVDGQQCAVINLTGQLRPTLTSGVLTGNLRGTLSADVRTGRVLRGKVHVDTNLEMRQGRVNVRSSGALEVTVTRNAVAPPPPGFEFPVGGDPITPPFTEAKDGKTKLIGGGFGRDPFQEFAPEGALLVGIEIGLAKFNSIEMIHAVRPVFRAGEKDILGQQQGTNWTNVKRLVAKPGYAVGLMTVKSGANADGLSLTFMRIKGDRLDPKDAYESEWIGDSRQGGRTVLGGEGRPVVGLHGSKNKENTTGIGLVFDRKLAAPVPPMPEKPSPGK